MFSMNGKFFVGGLNMGLSCRLLVLQVLLQFLKICVHGDKHGIVLDGINTSSSFYHGSAVLEKSNVTKPPPTTPGTPVVTITPATKVKYTLNLTNPGPSVLDSTLSFVAELKTENGEEIPKHMRFNYLWMNMADLKAERTDDHFTAKLPISFPSDTITAGDYTMTVVASVESNPSKILAFQTRKFVLTEKLNGHLHLHQNLKYQRLNNTFATGQPITARAVVVDHFTEEQTPHFEYFWYEGEKLLIATELSEVVTSIDKPSNFSLKSNILATMAVKRSSLKKVAEGNKSEADFAEAGEEERTYVTDEVKNGNFEERLFFKDPLSTCIIDRVDSEPGDRDVKIGVPAVINITCEGSAPTAVCLNVTAYNATSFTNNFTCVPETFVESLHHQVEVNLNQTGWNDVYFFVFNDVSSRQYTVAYYAYDPDSANIPALVLPIVFAVLGLLVVAGGAAYIMRLRKKPLVEVADFDFHPTLSESSTGGPSGMRLSLVANTIKYMIARRKWGSSRRPRRSSAHAARAAQLEGSTESQRSEQGVHLYDSL